MEERRPSRPGFGPRLPMDNPRAEEEPGKRVYTIERVPESPAKTHVHNPHLRKSKVATLAAALLLGTIIVLITTAALVYTLRTVHTNNRTRPPTPSSWAAEMIVSGEFRITNEPFRNSLYNHSSLDFRQLTKRIEKELATLYGNSQLWQEVQGVAVTSLRPGLEVECSLTLLPKNSLTIGRVGLTFLAGLNHSHGHLWLGPFAVDVLSIGFQARTEEVSWSQWSDWSDCQTSSGGELVRTRRRVCLSLEGLKLSRPEPCQAISMPNTNETESEPCAVPTTLSPVLFPTILPRHTTRKDLTKGIPVAKAFNYSSFTTMSTPTMPTRLATTSSSTTSTTYETASSSTRHVPKLQELITTESTTSSPDRGQCSLCSKHEVCVALDGDSVPVCRSVVDPGDPTGCGGLCQVDSEVCHRLDQGVYRCVDDSKCLDNEWQCGNSLCIPYVKRCDGHFNCYDHTDEHNCVCDLDTHFQCGKNLSCLPLSKRCDGIVDCWDAADESNCTTACLEETQFTCNNSQCIPSKEFCDGFVDCKDHSDEPFGCGGICKNHEWRCGNGRCIAKRDVCNGHDDCGDNSDEIKCGKRRGIRWT